ncbi:MAG: PEP-CTERM sorting domain-containing protein [Planctomycetota bacterium]
MKKSIPTLVAAIGLSSVATTTQANTVELNHTDRGTFVNTAAPLFTGQFRDSPSTSDGGELYQIRALNSGILTASIGPPIEQARNFHSFDLSGVSGTIETATFRIYADVGGYDSSAGSETVGLFDVSVSTAVLADPNATANAAQGALVYDDLGSSNVGVATDPTYGSFAVAAVDDASYIDVVLNAQAIADLQAAVDGGGSWSVGGALLTIDGTYNAGFISERVFKNDSTTASELPAQLVLTGDNLVPEPSSLALLGLGGLIAMRRRR